MNIGYCCISIGINKDRSKKDQILVNRGMIKKTFESKGLSYVSDLVIQNLNDTIKIIDWNIENNIFVYRLSSDSFPWMTNYNFKDLPNFDIIKELLVIIGNKIKDSKTRVSYHPGPFNVLASENKDVVIKTIDELNKHSELMDLMGLDISHYYPINIHIGTTKPNTSEAMNRFCKNFNLLSESCKKRLTVENDDSVNQYSVKMLFDGVYSKIGIPIVLDSLHYKCFSDNTSWKDTLELAISTWDVKPLCHHSSSKKLYEDKSAKLISHADFLYEKFENFGIDLDLELECKSKDIALKKYILDFFNNQNLQ